MKDIIVRNGSIVSAKVILKQYDVIGNFVLRTEKYGNNSAFYDMDKMISRQKFIFIFQRSRIYNHP